MENRGLLFIPDISGFTRFVNETEINHSRLIIQELLELLINANQMGLVVSEVEGDAVLFYKFGDAPDAKEIYRQVEKMFTEFHQQLSAYDQFKYCQCKACISAINLTLKVITHYGEFAGYNVKNFSKLIGKDVIVAHQLLKNDIDHHEYWLVTKSLLPDTDSAGLPKPMQWSSAAKQTETGEIPFYYTQLSGLRNKIDTLSVPGPELEKKAKVISLTKEYDSNLIVLFHAAGNFTYRSKWMEGVKAVEELQHYLPRVGQKCKYFLEEGEVIIYSNSYTFTEEKIVFTEAEEKGENITCYTLEKLAENKTRLTIDFYILKSPLQEFIFKFTRKKKIQDMMRRSMENLAGVAKGIILPPREL